eukprot:6356980-Prymnesium_polylepis.1
MASTTNPHVALLRASGMSCSAANPHASLVRSKVAVPTNAHLVLLRAQGLSASPSNPHAQLMLAAGANVKADKEVASAADDVGFSGLRRFMPHSA